MADYPRNLVVPTHIHTHSRYMLGTAWGKLSLGSPTFPGGSWTANAAIYIPLCLPWPYNVRRAFWINGASVTGNADIGIYSVSGARLWSAGSTAGSGVQASQYVAPSPDILLQPGVPYFLGFAYDGAGSVKFGLAGTTVTAILGRPLGLYQQLSALPLPSQATFAAYAAVGVPVIGITNTDSGF